MAMSRIGSKCRRRGEDGDRRRRRKPRADVWHAWPSRRNPARPHGQTVSGPQSSPNIKSSSRQASVPQKGAGRGKGKGRAVNVSLPFLSSPPPLPPTRFEPSLGRCRPEAPLSWPVLRCSLTQPRAQRRPANVRQRRVHPPSSAHGEKLRPRSTRSARAYSQSSNSTTCRCQLEPSLTRGWRHWRVRRGGVLHARRSTVRRIVYSIRSSRRHHSPIVSVISLLGLHSASCIQT